MLNRREAPSKAGLRGVSQGARTPPWESRAAVQAEVGPGTHRSATGKVEVEAIERLGGLPCHRHCLLSWSVIQPHVNL